MLHCDQYAVASCYGSWRTCRAVIDLAEVQTCHLPLCLTLANQAHHGHRRLQGGAGGKCGAAYSEGEGAPDRRRNRRCTHPKQPRFRGRQPEPLDSHWP